MDLDALFLQILMSAKYKRMIVKWLILLATILWVALTVCVLLATLEMGVLIAQVRLTFIGDKTMCQYIYKCVCPIPPRHLHVLIAFSLILECKNNRYLYNYYGQ